MSDKITSMAPYTLEIKKAKLLVEKGITQDKQLHLGNFAHCIQMTPFRYFGTKQSMNQKGEERS